MEAEEEKTHAESWLKKRATGSRADKDEEEVPMVGRQWQLRRGKAFGWPLPRETPWAIDGWPSAGATPKFVGCVCMCLWPLLQLLALPACLQQLSRARTSIGS